MTDQRSEKYCHAGRSQENIDVFHVIVVEEPKIYMSRGSQQVRLSETITWPIEIEACGLFKTPFIDQLNQRTTKRFFSFWNKAHFEIGNLLKKYRI